VTAPLAEIAVAAELESPVLLVVGGVVSLAEQLAASERATPVLYGGSLNP
jgi:siroheme synthase